MITENLSTLKIHKLTQEQYDREFEAGNTDETALYLTPDESAGQKTADGGEIFNDYENNFAGNRAHAQNTGTIAGCKCFVITQVEGLDDGFDITLDSVDGLEIGDIVSVDLQNQYINLGKIESIQNNIVHIDNSPEAYTFVEGESFLYVIDKPEVGSTLYAQAQSASGVGSKAIGGAATATGVQTTAAGYASTTEGENTFAGTWSHAQNLGTNASGIASTASGFQTEATGMYTDAGGRKTKAATLNSFTRGNMTSAGTMAYEVQEINIVEKTEESEDTYRVYQTLYVLSSDSEEDYDNTTFPTICDAIRHAEVNGNVPTWCTEIRLIGDVVEMGDLPDTWDFYGEYVIKSDSDSVKTIIDMTSSVNKELSRAYIGGEDEDYSESRSIIRYENVIIYDSTSTILKLGYSNVEFDKDVEFRLTGNSAIALGATGSSNVANAQIFIYPQKVVFDCPTPKFIYLTNSSITYDSYKANLELILNHPEIDTTVYFNAASGGKPHYWYGVNIDIKNASNVNFAKTENIDLKTTAAVQIIDQANLGINLETEGLVDIDSTKMCILKNTSGYKNAVFFTDTPCIFSVDEDYIVEAIHKKTDGAQFIIKAENGSLDVPCRYWELSIISYVSKTTITLNTTKGLSVGDVFSLKESITQNTVLNVGTIAQIGDLFNPNGNRIVIENDSTELSNFDLTYPTYLFVLDKPNLGTAEIGYTAFATGEKTKALGVNSEASGLGTIAVKDNQKVSGKYNAPKSNTLYEIGNGTSDNNRSNAFEVYEDGHAEVQNVGDSDNTVINKFYLSNNYRSINEMYPVGSIWIGGKYEEPVVDFDTGDVIHAAGDPINPADLFGGTWEIIDKEFASVAYNDQGTKGAFIKGDKISAYQIFAIYSGHTIRMRLYFIPTVALNDDSTVNIGKFDLEKIGISGFYHSIISIPAMSDVANGLVIASIGNSGVVEVSDIIKATTANQGLYINEDITCKYEEMLDSFCDKFYWKRIDPIEVVG